MKRLLVFSIILALASSCKSQNNNDKMDNEHLTYFSFDHHNSMVIDGEKYCVNLLKDGRIHIVIDEGLRNEKEIYTNDSSVFDSLLSIVKTFKMDKYKSDYKPGMQIFDGDSWSLYYKYDSKRSVSSGGYMAWPKNYHDARQALTDYFMKWRECKNSDPADSTANPWIVVLSIDHFRFTSKNNKGRDIEYSLVRGEKEATVTVKDVEKGIDKTVTVSNDIFDEFQEMAAFVMLKSSIYDYVPSDPDATFCTYTIHYESGDTIEGKTGYTQYPSQKESAIIEFFSRWL